MIFNEITSEYSHKPVNSILCPRCGLYKIQKLDNKIFGFCESCEAKYEFYFPAPYQELTLDRVFDESRREILVLYSISHFGTGKTFANAKAITKAMFKFPGFRVGVFFPSLKQARKILFPELELFFDDSDFERKNDDRWELKNGSYIEFIATDDNDNVRGLSYNATWAVEINAISPEVLAQVKHRARHESGFINELDIYGNPIVEYVNGKYINKVKQCRNFSLLEMNVEDSETAKNDIVIADKIWYTKNVNIENYKTRHVSFNNEKNIVTSEEERSRKEFILINMIDSRAKQSIINSELIGKDEEWMNRHIKVDIFDTSNDVIKGWRKVMVSDKPLNNKEFSVVWFTDFGNVLAKTTLLGAFFDPLLTKWTVKLLHYENNEPTINSCRNINMYKHQYSKCHDIGHFADPAGKKAKNMTSGTDMFDDYKRFGVKLQPADNRAEGNIILNKLIEEQRIEIISDERVTKEFNNYKYYFDKNNEKKVVKELEHRRLDFMDTLKYFANFIGLDKNKWFELARKATAKRSFFGADDDDEDDSSIKAYGMFNVVY